MSRPGAPDMALPEGMTCRDCKHFARCHALLSRTGREVECDWHPVRFVASELARTAPGPAEGDGGDP